MLNRTILFPFNSLRTAQFQRHPMIWALGLTALPIGAHAAVEAGVTATAAVADPCTSGCTGSAAVLLGAMGLAAGVLFVFALAKLKGMDFKEALSDTNDPSSTATTAADGSKVTTTAVPEKVASSSRLIAFFGMLVMLVVYFGFAAGILWHLMVYGSFPSDMKDAVMFLSGGGVLFLPYAANQAQSALSGLLK